MATVEDDAPTYETITLTRWRDQWIAVDEERGVKSQPMPTRREALDDLDENVALAEGDLELSDDTERALEETEGEYERGETVSMDDLDI